MPLPWQSQNAEPVDEQVDLRGEAIGGRTAPRFHRNLNLRDIDTRAYFRTLTHHHKDLGVVASAKTHSAVLNQFVEETVGMVDQYGQSVPSDYDIGKDMKESIRDKRLLTNLERVHVTELNAVQRKAIRVIRDGIGLLVQAPTGIGKTYAFLIPAIEKALIEREKRGREPKKPSPFVMIIANTGTLVKQLHSRCELIMGMKDLDGCEAIHEIRTDMLVADHRFTTDACHIAFCTMGKLKASLENGDVVLDDLKMIVVDEADKMIDTAAFGMDIRWVLDSLKEDVRDNMQTCFFSATYTHDCDGALALSPLQMDMFHGSPWKFVRCGNQIGYIKQRIIKINRPNKMSLETLPLTVKMNTIRALIEKDLAETGCKKEGPYEQTIAIFCETVQRVTQVCMALRLLGYNFKPVCRTVTKKQQEVTLNDLEFKRIHGIVCTNIMSRGIDVSSIKHTIIMEMSTDFDTYRHRIGRVGRDGSGGVATVLIDYRSLLDGRSALIVDQLYDYMRQCQEQVPMWLEEWSQARHPDEYP